MASTYCPQCGNRADQGNGVPGSFCTSCGARLSGSVQNGSDDVRRALEAALTPLRACDIPNAEVAVAKAERLCPMCSDVWYMKALMATGDRRHQLMYIAIAESGSCESMGVFLKDTIRMYAEQWREEAAAVIARAGTFIERNDPATASRILDRAIMMYPDCSDVWYMRSAIASDPVWKRNYMLAGDGMAVSLYIFGKEDAAASARSRMSEAEFRWRDPADGESLRVAVGGKEFDLASANGYRASVSLEDGTYDVGAEHVRQDGRMVGERRVCTVTVDRDAVYWISFSGMFKSRMAIQRI